MASADDGTGGTGIKSVEFTISGKKNGVAADETKTATFDLVSGKYSTLVSIDGWDEGDLTVTAAATDNAGNEGTKTAEGVDAESTYTYDKNAPTVSDITIKVGDEAVTSGWINGSFTASGTVTDTLVLSKGAFVLKVNGTPVSTGIDFSEETTTSYKWSYEVTVGESGTYDITADAKDTSGKAAATKTAVVSIDHRQSKVHKGYSVQRQSPVGGRRKIRRGHASAESTSIAHDKRL